MRKKLLSGVKKSAKLNYVHAQLALAGMYSNGIGVEKDEEKASEWYENLAHPLNKREPSVQKARENA